MAWGPIVVGVDASPAAVGAAVLGERIAKLAGVRCELIHAVRDAWAPLVAVNPNVPELPDPVTNVTPDVGGPVAPALLGT